MKSPGKCEPGGGQVLFDKIIPDPGAEIPFGRELELNVIGIQRGRFSIFTPWIERPPVAEIQ